MARVACRHLVRNFHTLKSAGWLDTCGGSRIKNRLINTRPGLTSLEWLIPGITCASLLILFAGTLCLAQPQSGVPSVIKVEPPSWWANHSVNPVRLLIRGENLKGALVKADQPQILVSDLRGNRSGTYLFVNVRISSAAKPGDYPLIVETAQSRAMVPFHLN